MADSKKTGRSKPGNEEPRYSESFPVSGGEYNNLSGTASEESRIPEANDTGVQMESDRMEDRENGMADANKSSRTRTSGSDARTGKAVTRLLVGMTALTGAVLLLVNIVANRVPEANLKDFYVGADYIEYSIDVSGLDDGQILTLNVGNDYESYSFPVNAGENSGTVSGLTPSTGYQFRLVGDFGYGSASLISKSLVTAGTAPSAEIRSLSYTVTDSGEVDLHIDIGFSDVDEKITQAELVWLYSDGTESGGRTLLLQNGNVDILAFDGSGKVDFYLYATVDGVKSLYSTDSLTFELTPRVNFELADTAEGTQLRLRVLPMGSTLTGVRVRTDENDGETPFDLELSASEALSYTHLFSDWDDDISHTVYCRVEYEYDGQPQAIEMSRTAEGGFDADCKLISVKDSGTEMTLTFDASFDSMRVDRTEVLMRNGNRSVSVGNADLSEPVRVRGLKAGVSYTVSVRFWSGDLFTEVPLGTLTPDYPATVHPSVWVSEGRIICTLQCDDPYSYYSGFAVSMTAENATKIIFAYDAATGTYVAPYASMQSNLRYLLTVSADTVRPSDASSDVTRRDVCRETVMN